MIIWIEWPLIKIRRTISSEKTTTKRIIQIDKEKKQIYAPFYHIHCFLLVPSSFFVRAYRHALGACWSLKTSLFKSMIFHWRRQKKAKSPWTNSIQRKTDIRIEKLLILVLDQLSYRLKFYNQYKMNFSIMMLLEWMSWVKWIIFRWKSFDYNFIQELSHRSASFGKIIETAERDIRQIL